MLREQDIGPVSLLSRVQVEVELSRDILAIKLGTPGLELLAAEIEGMDGVQRYCDKKGYIQVGQADKLRLPLLEQGVKLACRNPSDKNLAIAREAIQTSLAEPIFPDDPRETHYPFLWLTREFRTADRDHLVPHRQPIEIELLTRIFPYTDSRTAVLVLEDIFGFEEEMLREENLNGYNGDKVALRREALSNVFINIKNIILENPGKENISAWSTCLLAEAERLPQEIREVVLNQGMETEQTQRYDSEQDEFLSLLDEQIAAIYDLDDNTHGVGIALARNLLTLFRLNHPAVLDRRILRFVRFAPVDPEALAFLADFTQGNEDEQLAAVDVLVDSTTINRICENQPRKESLKTLADLLFGLLKSSYESVRLAAFTGLSRWIIAAPTFTRVELTRLSFRGFPDQEADAFITGVHQTMEHIDPDFMAGRTEEPSDALAGYARQLLPHLTALGIPNISLQNRIKLNVIRQLAQ